MISYDFEYYKPATIEEATQLFQALDEQGKKPIYFSGGTEVITLGRLNKIITGAVIDIKAIPECQIVKEDKDNLHVGAALSLTEIIDMQKSPFLSETISQIADNTARNKITLGGNICANIFYREAVLPLLLTESDVIIAGPTGLTQHSIMDRFNQNLQLEKGEFLVQIATKQNEIKRPFVNFKKRRQWDVGYPLITAAALKKNGKIKIAFSGLCAFPFRNKRMEESFNNLQLCKKERIDQVIKHIPSPVLDDVHGSAEYRMFVLKNTLFDVLDAFEGVDS